MWAASKEINEMNETHSGHIERADYRRWSSPGSQGRGGLGGYRGAGHLTPVCSHPPDSIILMVRLNGQILLASTSRVQDCHRFYLQWPEFKCSLDEIYMPYT